MPLKIRPRGVRIRGKSVPQETGAKAKTIKTEVRIRQLRKTSPNIECDEVSVLKRLKALLAGLLGRKSSTEVTALPNKSGHDKETQVDALEINCHGPGNIGAPLIDSRIHSDEHETD